ncbi:uncharacterized protein LTR77_005414 [Saxophila tyrrhenica]|uniref:Aminoglycoside phosphotransferase domain-containing protein n=1 Tax=Saxophila tyrrhenica TaxID=1690608 RepID=A0AAV9P8U6_9PEZI|nr:hypothetical protein LTR77_005414 [Saxophila tyrrhenica]
MQYVKAHSAIPVPTVLFSNLDHNNVPYVIMDRLPGKPLRKLWQHLSLDHKRAAIRQTAWVLSQLSSLKFNRIGGLHPGGVGSFYPMLWHGHPPAVHFAPLPITSRALLSPSNFPAQPDTLSPPELGSRKRFEEPSWRSDIHDLRQQPDMIIRSASSSPLLQPPFRLIHADFDAQNLLFAQLDEDCEPLLAGVIDWDHAFTGPLYYLFEYPIFMQDDDSNPEQYAENKILRQELVRSLQECSQELGESPALARQCFQE